VTWCAAINKVHKSVVVTVMPIYQHFSNLLFDTLISPFFLQCNCYFSLLMIVPTATTALLMLFLTPSYGYVSSLIVFFTLRESTRTIPLPSLDHSQRNQQSCVLTLAATNDPVAPLLLASASEMERKLVKVERMLEKAEAQRKLAEVEADRKLEKMEMEAERKLEKMEMEAERKLKKMETERNLEKMEAERNLDKMEMEWKLEKAERKQGKKCIISSSFIVFTLLLSFLCIVIVCR